MLCVAVDYDDLHEQMTAEMCIYYWFYLWDIYLLYELYTKYKKTGKKRDRETDADRQTTECNQHVD